MILRRLPQLVAGALLLGAGGTAWAQASARPADAGVPLQETQKALRQLQKEQAQGQAGKEGTPRDALPTIAAPDLTNAAAASGLPAVARDRRSEDEATRRKREAQRNWLVDGMLRLEGRKADGTVATGLEDEDEEMLEGSDPDFLLKTYMKEQQAAEAKDKKDRKEAPAAESNDPMAPFLREWLSGSPVEKTALAGAGVNSAGRPDASPGGSAIEFMGASVPNPDAGGSSTAVTFEGLGDRGAGAPGARENPFLQGLDMGSLPNAGGGPAYLPPVVANPTPPPAAPPAAVPNVFADPLPGRAPERRPPPSALKENEKYFPQQKKF